MNTKVTSNAILLLTAVIWGFAFVAQVEGTKYIGSFTMTGIRFIIGAVVLLPVILIFEKGRMDKAERILTLKASLITGTVLFCASIFQQFGIQLTSSAGVSGLITGLYMIFVPFAYFMFFRNKVGVQVWVGAAIAFIGLIFLCYKSGEGFSFGLGELLLLIGSFFWTAHVMLVDYFGKKVRSVHFSCGQFLTCGTLGIVCALMFERISVTSVMDAKWAILYCGVLSSGVAYTLQVIGQKKADPSTAVIIMSTESAFSAIGGFLFGIDKITYTAIAGCILMFFGIICSQIVPKKRKIKDIEYKST